MCAIILQGGKVYYVILCSRHCKGIFKKLCSNLLELLRNKGYCLAFTSLPTAFIKIGLNVC